MLLFYIRHGDPIYNPDSLTALGKRQAEAIAKRIAIHGIDKIFSSTSNRAYETALPLSEITKKEIIKMDFLNEAYAWKYFTITDEEKRKWIFDCPAILKTFVNDKVRQLGFKWYEYYGFAQYKFKEGIEYFDKSIDEFMISLGYRHDRINHTYKAQKENNDRVAMFAHAGMGSVFLSSILDIPYSEFVAHYDMSHTGMTVIKFDNIGDEIVPKLLQFSNDSHLYKEGLPANYNNNTAI